jgi:flavin-dependent dehydrogenase
MSRCSGKPPDVETIETDIAIVGGGPSGAVAAIRLAGLGHRVLVVERERFPRAHVGEALSPGVSAQLDCLGLAHLARDSGGICFETSRARWQAGDWETRPSHPGAMTVDRGRFDHALLKAAGERGAIILQPARAARPSRTAEGWALEAKADGRDFRIRARFLIDASGRSGFLPRNRKRSPASIFALHAYWQSGMPERPCVAAARDHWLWASPVPGLGHSVMVFLDRTGLGRRRGNLERHYRRDVAEAGLLDDGERRQGAIRVCDATAYEDIEVAGPDFLKIGEAAFALDPLSASGVQKAIATALTGANVANTILRRPQTSELALNFYAAEQRLSVERHCRWTSDTYRSSRFHGQDPFWSALGAMAPPVISSPPPFPRPGGLLELSPDTRLEEVATLSADFVEPRLGVVHPRLERPIAYLGGIALAPFLRRHLPATAGDLADELRRLAPDASPLAAIERLVAAGILSGADPAGQPRNAAATHDSARPVEWSGMRSQLQ